MDNPTTYWITPMTNAEMLVSRIRDPMIDDLTQSDSTSEARTGAGAFAGAVPSPGRAGLYDARLMARRWRILRLAQRNNPPARGLVKTGIRSESFVDNIQLGVYKLSLGVLDAR